MDALKNANIADVIAAMADAANQYFSATGRGDPIMVGIHTGGVWVAEALAKRLHWPGAMGKLDISFYRDDFTRIGIHPQVKPSDMPDSLDDRHVLLVDDVLYTGRTIRAAMGEMFDYGRPASITLAVLIDRGGRELPVQPDITGIHAPLAARQHVKLKGPEPLSLVLSEDSPAE